VKLEISRFRTPGRIPNANRIPNSKFHVPNPSSLFR